MNLPIVIAIVDSEEKPNEFLPALERMIGGGLVTLEKIKVIHYRHKKPVEPDVERLSYALPDVPASFLF